MFRDDRFVRAMQFGCDTQRLHIRLDLRCAGEFTTGVVFHQPAGVLVQTPSAKRGSSGKVTVCRPDAAELEGGEFAADEIVEMSVPFSALSVEAGTTLKFQVKIFEKGIERECYPENSPIELAVPGPESSLAEWVV